MVKPKRFVLELSQLLRLVTPSRFVEELQLLRLVTPSRFVGELPTT